MSSDDKIKRERIQVYFDVICGATCSISALIGIFAFVLPGGDIQNTGFFVIGATFWFGYLLISFYLIGLGIFTYYANKNYEIRAKSKKPKKLKAPLIS